ncbi:hypothetical protein E4U15_002533 [Claviceps sp. LM218 group G6]|nr:hypothetical protein E4U15_002533 [Claviceps sp. LM218 group G6]KAG6112629.1 hypothetical protein E4U14_001986 [Claviceps sp. LM454 group G7]
MLVLRPGTPCQHGRSGCGVVVLVLMESSASPDRGSSGSNPGRKSVDDLAVASITMMVEKSVAAGESANGKLKHSHEERGYVQLGKKREVNVSRGCSTATAHWADLPCAPSLARRNDQGSFEKINDGVVHYCEAKRTPWSPWQDNGRVRVKTQDSGHDGGYGGDGGVAQSPGTQQGALPGWLRRVARSRLLACLRPLAIWGLVSRLLIQRVLGPLSLFGTHERAEDDVWDKS